MPRHNLNKYNPADDSTAGFKTDAAEHKALVLNTKTRTIGEGDKAKTIDGCPCGCEGEPVGAKRVFLMGHDARLRGKLIRAHLTDTPVRRLRDGKLVKQHSAADEAKLFGKSFTDALKAAGDRRAEANRALLQKAMGSKRLIKVGRSEFTGQVVAVFEGKGNTPTKYEVEYVDKAGKTKKTKVNATDAPVATKADEKRIAPKPAATAKANGKPADEAKPAGAPEGEAAEQAAAEAPAEPAAA